MFTGLVEGQGTVRQIASLPVGLRLSIAPDADCFTSSELAIGDSVSICGCCLTVVAIRGDVLDFEAGDETLSKTNLGRFKSAVASIWNDHSLRMLAWVATLFRGMSMA